MLPCRPRACARFRPGEHTAVISVTLVDDDEHEPDKEFYVHSGFYLWRPLDHFAVRFRCLDRYKDKLDKKLLLYIE